MNLEQLDHYYFTLQFIQRYHDPTHTAFLFNVSLPTQEVYLLTLAGLTIIPPSQHEAPLQVSQVRHKWGWGVEGSGVEGRFGVLKKEVMSPAKTSIASVLYIPGHLRGLVPEQQVCASVLAPRSVSGDLC